MADDDFNDRMLRMLAPVFFKTDIPDDWEDQATPRSVSLTSKAGHMAFTMNQFVNGQGTEVLAELRLLVLMLDDLANSMEENMGKMAASEEGGLS